MRYSIKQNWLGSLQFIMANPIVLVPFAIIAFIEGLALELLYFSSRRPISFLVSPIIRKLFGEGFVHYPGNLLLLPKLFYYAQVVIYIIVGVFLAAAAISIFKTIDSNQSLKLDSIIKKSAKRYASFITYGLLLIVLLFLLKKADIFVLSKFFRLASRYVPNLAVKLLPFVRPIMLFLTSIILQTFLILTIPIMVLRKKSLLKALGGSIYLGARNFLSLFTLIFLPFLLYFPISLLKLKVVSLKLTDLTFPEINLYIIVAGIIVSIFIDCFIVVCASQFLLDVEKRKT